LGSAGRQATDRRNDYFQRRRLNPDEVDVDFSRKALPSQPKLGTIGLWCGRHGKSFLQAGKHHLECRFDHALLRQRQSKAMHFYPTASQSQLP
jgi:hypothetical protein